MGPLEGVKVVEIAGIGPGPFCAMMLADMGAELVRVDRVDRAEMPTHDGPNLDVMGRGRRSVAVNLKNPEGVEVALRLADRADVLLEGFRAGVAERIGIGPDVCLERNPRLVYGRMTGWGQEGPLAKASGHDINYIALAGALHGIGRAGERPVPPLNLVGDFGGGGMLLAFGIVCALYERERSGKGQVVDAAMVDGAAALMTLIHGLRHMGIWTDQRGENLLDTGAHFYDVYETADGKYISIGAIEPQFYAELLQRLELEGEDLPHTDRARWPELKERFEKIFKARTRQEWCEILEGTDVCFAPVLSIPEAYEHPHNRARKTFVEVAGTLQPGPAPRFSRTACQIRRPPAWPGEHTDETLANWGFPSEEISRLRKIGAIA